MTLLSIGDSIGEDLGYGLGDVFSTDSAVRVVQEGVEDTGLSRADYYNWPGALEVDLRRYHPKIVVVMMGANDAQAFYDGNNTCSRSDAPRATRLGGRPTRPASRSSWTRRPTPVPMSCGWVCRPMGPGLDGTGLASRTELNKVFASAGAHPSRRDATSRPPRFSPTRGAASPST